MADSELISAQNEHGLDDLMSLKSAAAVLKIDSEVFRRSIETVEHVRHGRRVFVRASSLGNFKKLPQHRSGRKKKSTTKRKCLRCEKMFDSEGIGNRLCLTCKSFAAQCI